MTKRFIPLLAFLFSSFLMFAQTPERVYLKNINSGSLKSSSIACVDQDAGDVQGGNVQNGTFTGQSNDIDFPQAFFCFGDEMEIDHIAGTADLTGDPDLGTPAGIGYALYSCAPTIPGLGIVAILLDPCIQGNPAPQTMDPIWITTGDIDGDITFSNAGIIQDTFNNGGPIEIFFAPITIDNFATRNYEQESDANNMPVGPGGPCTNVSIDQAFSVVYLNEIIISNPALLGTSGSFIIEGGLPEFDLSNYTISITNAADPSIVGSIANPNLGSGDAFNYTVPQEGTYNIVVTDNKGCTSATASSTSMACSGIDILFTPTVISPNGVGCLSVTTNGFVDIASIQFAIVYDPNVITLNLIDNFNPNLAPPLTIAAFGTATEGQINFSYFDFAGNTLPDGAVLFDLCFNGDGTIGEFSNIDIDPNASTPAEVLDTDGITTGVLTPVCHFPSVVEIGNLILTPSVTPSTCFGDTLGEIDFTITGGNPPYTYTYENLADASDMGSGNVATDGGMDNLTGLDGGASYQIIVLDSTIPDPEEIMETINIPDGTAVGANVTSFAPICAGDNTGQIELNVVLDGFAVTLPDPNFSILWNTMETTPTITDLPADFYEVDVTHIPSGCVGSASVTLTNPAPIDAGLTSQIATCAGEEDGSVTAMPVGGMGPYFYNWDNPDITNANLPATTATVINLDPGRYYVTITDSNGSGCIHIDSIDVGATTIILSNAVGTAVSCFGASNGAIDLTPTAIGTNNGGYSFDWNDLPGAMNPEDRMMIDGMLYEVTITDAAGCTLVETFDIVEPVEIETTLDAAMNETCQVGMDGSATVSVTGGVGTLLYDWGTTPNQTTPTASNLVGGNYTVTVTDDNMCMDSLLVIILPPDPPVLSMPDTTFLDCSTSIDGSLEVMVLASSSPVTSYAWSPNTADNTPNVNNLGVGTYFVTVTTQDGCFAVDTSVIASPNPISLVDTTTVLPNCIEDTNGQVTVFVEGGTPPYNYSWDTPNGTNASVVAGLGGNVTYCVTVTDSNNCDALETCIYLPLPPAISAEFTNITMVSCNDGITCDASATPLVSGGTGGNDYDFTWANGESDSIAVALCAGWNLVEFDDGACTLTDSVFIDAPDVLSAASIMITEPTCFGDADGGASLLGSGGTPPYFYEWETGSLTDSIVGVPAGSYSVSIEDSEGCLFPFVVFIAQPDSLVATVDQFGTSDALCFGEDDGDISVVWTGGNSGNATFQWTSNVSNTAIASGLPIGTYNITVTDPLGCSDTTEHTINQPPPIFVNIPTPMEPECFGFQTFITLDTVFGGNPGIFTYSVDNGPQQLVNAAIPIFADLNHTISVFDSEGCRLDTMIFVGQPDEVIVNLGNDEEIQLGDSIQLNPIASSSFPIDTLFWTPADFLSCTNCFEPWSSPLSTQAYTFTIIDVNGCEGSDDIVIDVDKNRNIFIPNIFSPNGDGFNDLFKVESGPGVVDVNFMYIFDRWGEQLFERTNFVPSNDIDVGWNGTFRGKQVQTGVYVYIIEVDFADGITLLYRGDVTVIR